MDRAAAGGLLAAARGRRIHVHHRAPAAAAAAAGAADFGPARALPQARQPLGPRFDRCLTAVLSPFYRCWTNRCWTAVGPLLDRFFTAF